MKNFISGRTAVCGILLHPAAHTRSPAMHNAAFLTLGIDAVYVAFDVPPQRLSAAVAGVRALGLRQVAVSLPHKVAVLAELDEIDAVARRIGAVNTVTLSEERLVGSNTDWIGAVRALEKEGPLEGRRCVVLGAGGAARAIVYGLLERGARVVVLNRKPERARELAASLGPMETGDINDVAKYPYDVLINATSVGLARDESPVPASALRAGSVVMDSVYEPEPTRLLCEAAHAGAKTISGKWMLVYQAAEQVRLWTGRDAPVDAMVEAFEHGPGVHRSVSAVTAPPAKPGSRKD